MGEVVNAVVYVVAAGFLLVAVALPVWLFVGTVVGIVRRETREFKDLP